MFFLLCNGLINNIINFQKVKVYSSLKIIFTLLTFSFADLKRIIQLQQNTIFKFYFLRDCTTFNLPAFFLKHFKIIKTNRQLISKINFQLRLNLLQSWKILTFLVKIIGDFRTSR